MWNISFGEFFLFRLMLGKQIGVARQTPLSVGSEDKRGRVLILTLAGQELLSHAVPIWKQSHEEADRLIPEPGLDRLRAALTALLEDGREASDPELSAATATMDQEATR